MNSNDGMEMCMHMSVNPKNHDPEGKAELNDQILRLEWNPLPKSWISVNPAVMVA